MYRTHFLKTSVYRGFTLIELLVVIAIIGLLSTIIAGPIQNARNKAKDSKKVADVKNIQNALTLYADDNGTFPDTLGASGTIGLYPKYLDSNLPNFAAGYTPAVDKYMYGVYRNTSASTFLGTAYTNFGYHIGVHLTVTGNLAMDSDSDCNGIGAGATNCVTQSGTAYAVDGPVKVVNFSSAAADPGAPADSNTDFGAGGSYIPDTSATACTSAFNTCLFDVKGSI